MGLWRVEGWEHQVLSTSGGGICNALTGPPTIDTTIYRTGGAASIKFTQGQDLTINLPASTYDLVAHFYFYLQTWPSEGSKLMQFHGLSNVNFYIYEEAYAGKDCFGWYTSAGSLYGNVTPYTGQWHRIDIHVDSDSGAILWAVDGTNETAHDTGESSTAMTSFELHSQGSQGSVHNFDDMAFSLDPTDYKIDDGYVVLLSPDAAGTSAPGSVIYDNGDTLVNDSTNPADVELDEIPINSSADYIKQTGIGASNYAEVTFDNMPSGDTPLGVSAYLAYHAAGVDTCHGKATIEGDTSDSIFDGDMSETSLFYKSLGLTEPGGGWTEAKVNALTGRVGHSTDVTPNPYWDAILLQLYYTESAGPSPETTGQVYPASAESVSETPWSDDTWDNPTNIYADGGGEASVTAKTFDLGDQTYVLKAYNFDFSGIPDGREIYGVICRINAWHTTDDVSIDLCQLLDTSRAKGGTNKAATPVGLTTNTADVHTFGNSTDLWGNALTTSWVKDADFGVAIGCIANSPNEEVYVDYVSLEIYYEGEAGTTLVVADGTHSHASDPITLTQAHTLAMSEATHGHATDPISLTQAHTLVVNEATHGHTTDAIDLIEDILLAVAEALHGHSTDGIDLTQAHELAMQEATHGHGTDPIALTQAHTLVVNEAGHGHSTDPISLTQAHTLVVAEATHGHTTDPITLTQSALLAVQEAIHSHLVDNIGLTQAHVLAIQEALHSHGVDPITLSQAHQLVVSEALHGHLADNITLEAGVWLIVQEALHSHMTDAINLTQEHDLTVQEAAHAHAADAFALTQAHTLAVSESTHGHTVDNINLDVMLVVQEILHLHSTDLIDLVQEHDLAVSESTHSHSADNIFLILDGGEIVYVGMGQWLFQRK